MNVNVDQARADNQMTRVKNRCFRPCSGLRGGAQGSNPAIADQHGLVQVRAADRVNHPAMLNQKITHLQKVNQWRIDNASSVAQYAWPVAGVA